MDQLDPEPVWCRPLIVPVSGAPFQWECQAWLFTCIPGPCAARMWHTHPQLELPVCPVAPETAGFTLLFPVLLPSLGISVLMAPCPSVSPLVGFPGVSLQFSWSSTLLPCCCSCPCSAGTVEAPRMSPQSTSSVAEEGFYSFVLRKLVSRDKGGFIAKEKRWKKNPKVMGKAPHPTQAFPEPRSPFQNFFPLFCPLIFISCLG